MTKKYSDITFYYDLYTAMYYPVLFAEVLITDIDKEIVEFLIDSVVR